MALWGAPCGQLTEEEKVESLLQVILHTTEMSPEDGQLPHYSHYNAHMTTVAAKSRSEQNSMECAWWLVLHGSFKERGMDLFWFTGRDRLYSWVAWYSQGAKVEFGWLGGQASLVTFRCTGYKESVPCGY